MLVAAAAGEDALNQGGDGDHVFNHEGLQLHAQRHVFHRHLQQAATGIANVLVQPGHVVGGVFEYLGAVVTETGDGLGDHGGAVFFTVGRIHRNVLVEGEIRRTQEAGQFTPTGPAQYVEQEQAVGGGDIADPEQGVTAGVAVNVRHPEVVPLDVHLVTGGIQSQLTFPVASVGAQQRGGLEVVSQLIICESRFAAHQGIVEAQLIIEVRLLGERGDQAGFRDQIIQQGADQVPQTGDVGGEAAEPTDIILAGGQDVEHGAVIRKGCGDGGGTVRWRFRRGCFRFRGYVGGGRVGHRSGAAGAPASTGADQAGGKQRGHDKSGFHGALLGTLLFWREIVLVRGLRGIEQ